MAKTQIVIEDYNPIWADWFNVLSNEISPKISPYADQIVHVGSTSVPGLSAKPIIDIEFKLRKYGCLIATFCKVRI